MINNLNVVHPGELDDGAFNDYLVAAFRQHVAAEQAEERRAAAMQPPTRPKSPYLQLTHELFELQEKNLLANEDQLETALATTSYRGLFRWQTLQSYGFQRAASFFIAFCLASTLVVSYNVYAEKVRARPATVNYVNAPLSDVVAELRRRSGLDIRLCNIPPGENRVTLTLTDTPIDSVLHQISRQNELRVNWGWDPSTVFLQPHLQLDGEHSASENLWRTMLSFTRIGCSP